MVRPTSSCAVAITEGATASAIEPVWVTSSLDPAAVWALPIMHPVSNGAHTITAAAARPEVPIGGWARLEIASKNADKENAIDLQPHHARLRSSDNNL